MRKEGRKDESVVGEAIAFMLLTLGVQALIGWSRCGATRLIKARQPPVLLSALHYGTGAL